MPILRLNAGPEGVVLNGSPACARRAIARAAGGTGPVIIAVHGFKYDPASATCSPHSTIFGRPSQPMRAGRVQWLRPLGFGTGNVDEGLAIAFGWPARFNLWKAGARARVAGRGLAQVIGQIKARAPQRAIHVIAHSLGSEVVFEALHALPAGSVQRVVALSGASYASRARAALQTPAGQGVELFNITSRENDIFDFMFERLIPAPVAGDVAMGAGLALPNVATLELDCPRSLTALRQFGGYIDAPVRRMCHWSSYTRPGVLPFYAHLLRTPEAVPLAALARALPDAAAPRWSRLFARPQLTLPTARMHKPAS